MRIAMISTMTGWSWGGSEELWFQAALAARRDGHDVGVALCRPYDATGPLGVLRDAGVRLLDPPRIIGGGRWQGVKGRLLDRVSHPFRSVLNFRPDVVCIAQGGTYDVAVQPAFRPLVGLPASIGAPYAVVCQMNEDFNVVSDDLSAVAGPFLSGAAVVAFVADGNRRSAERQLATRLPRATVVRNPVNLTDTSAVDYPTGPVATLASVARLSAWAKGHDVLFEALAGAGWPADRWRLNLYGQGPDRSRLERLVEFFGLQKQVMFHGQVADVRRIWADNQMLVLASRFEGTPLALVEAMLCGRPSVVTDVGGNVEWVTDGRTGFVADAPTVRSLTAALSRAWDRRADWAGLGVNARADALKLCDPDPGRTLLGLLTGMVGG